MNILNKITAHKREEIAQQKSLVPIKKLEQSLYFESPTVSLTEYLLRPDKSGIIAEFKRKSPSKGAINPHAEVEAVSIGYMQAGASALSVLTDAHFFGGSQADLSTARQFNYCPILRKDFVLDEYQIIEARSMGADAILLIAECLSGKEVRDLARFAKSLNLEVLLEVHSAEELEKYVPEVDAIGVNNRNLKDFSVSIASSLDLIDQLPKDAVPVSESGISDPEVVVRLKDAGYRGFLIGEYFMRHAEPARACREFVQRIQHLENLYQNAIA